MSDRDALRALIAAVRRRWLAEVGLWTLGRAAAAAALPLGAALTVERLFQPEGLPLVVLAGFAVVAALAAAAAVVFRMQRRPDDRQVARFIEERGAALGTPLDDVVVSATDAMSAKDPAAAPFAGLVVRSAFQRLNGIAAADVVAHGAIARAAAFALAGAALFLAIAFLARNPASRALETAWVGLFPSSIQVEVLPGDARIVAGKPLFIRVVVRRSGRLMTQLAPVLTVSAGAEQRAVPMVVMGDAFSFAFESVDRTFKYRVSAGAARSREYTVTAVFPPQVRRIDLLYQYPKFTGQAAREEQDGGDIFGPAGTRVKVRIHADKPVVGGDLALGSKGTAALTTSNADVLETDLVLARDDSYRVRLSDADGLRSTGDTEYFIRLMDDRPPDVRILRPAGDQQITPLEEVAIEARADDDYGISTFELVYSTPQGQSRTIPFTRVSSTGVAKIGAHLLAAEDLRVQPGDVISYYARAKDVARGKRSSETRSDMFFLEVRPFNEEFVAAQSQAGAAGTDPQLESLISAQKEIITATWNLERRSAAGRSSEDLRALALAQAELKTRVEQMSGRRRGRSPFRMPQQLLPPRPGRPPGAGADPIGAAVDAMGRALQQLEGQRTSDALPHEMAALQALLQAQAEVQRRQVMQQQNAGAGGSGRQGQDLSALFDKELQRQQRTNYETRSQIEERPDEARDGSAIDRLRDLARRQEELSRRQREMAEAGLNDEERKRQLERLTREQAEIRRQAEELARQMGQQSANADSKPGSSQSSGGSKPSGQGGGSGSMRDASEQMRSAENDLQRQDPKAAAESAARAADRLRQIEQQMRGDSPESRQRAAGELQLEAQQIAEEQRRIAGEAERLDRGSAGAGADARRRLAGEKDRLADRVDALQRSAGELAKATREKSPSGIGEAARELERQQLGRRMRDTAQGMRAGTGGEKGEAASEKLAGTEQQIARALDKVVEQLGGGGEGRNLSAELGQTRDIRDRLDRLEQQIKDGESREQASKPGEKAPGSTGRQGAQGQQGSGGGGQGGELQKLREEYGRELQRARETLSRLSRLDRGDSRESLGGATPEEHEWSRADPGTEAFKQDFAGWESLRKDVRLALERHERAVSSRLAKKTAEDRLSAGGSDRVPDAYARLIARYYEALARARK